MKTAKRNGPIPKPALERFLQKVEKTAGCWFWLGAKNNHGYGMFMLESPDKILAHRAAWILFRGVIPPGACLLHICDTPNCVNPAHLRPGTQSENMAEMRAKGRHKFVAHYGAANGQAKLSAEATSAIHTALSVGRASHAEIAAIFGVTRARVSQLALEGRHAVKLAEDAGFVEDVLRARSAGCSHVEIEEVFGMPKREIQVLLNGAAPKRDAKLDAQLVKELRHLARSGLSRQEIANRLGVSKALVTQVILGRAWAHVPDEETPIALV